MTFLLSKSLNYSTLQRSNVLSKQRFRLNASNFLTNTRQYNHEQVEQRLQQFSETSKQSKRWTFHLFVTFCCVGFPLALAFGHDKIPFHDELIEKLVRKSNKS
ncbi:hypothetical protein RFI_24024 [Reticulomyxa filosa]|uniref:Transmembrane protein n=1 Tax=Reticulomyxa filosa TaxID=46433 RepID=X6MI86_RETFI|nr:hypothetical protein RFI_24024 [Reticulomyxa filosa]|eukprot:ETO13356.1 hypothetical protein RFI_24024 [Reticulomyxa filosa]